MCLFSGPIKEVSSTRIFARHHEGGQYLAYQMSYAATSELAMILPLPVPPDVAEDAVRFINLEAYPEFFRDLQSSVVIYDKKEGETVSLDAAPEAEVELEVQDVGSFEASFVPRLSDLSRLDKRFRLDDAIWKLCPQYDGYGFAVFKLKAEAQSREVHPMAFWFPSREPDRLFFPTVHVHDGQFHDHASFDHFLFTQTDRWPQLEDQALHETLRDAGVGENLRRRRNWLLDRDLPNLQAAMTTPEPQSCKGSLELQKLWQEQKARWVLKLPRLERDIEWLQQRMDQTGNHRDSWKYSHNWDVDQERARGLLLDEHAATENGKTGAANRLWGLRLSGNHANRDTWVRCLVGSR